MLFSFHRFTVALILATFFAPPAFAAGEVMIGQPCSGGANGVDYDTVFQCNTSTGKFQRAAPFTATTLAIGTTATTPGADVDFSQSTNAMIPPRGTTAQQTTCNAAMQGAQRFNTSTNLPEYCSGSAWTPFKVTGIPSGGGAFVASDSSPSACFESAITTITFSGTTATITTQIPHGHATGDTLTITDAVPSTYNGTFSITVTGTKTFTVTLSATPTGNATTPGQLCGSGGLAAANAYCLRELTTNTGWFGYSNMQAAGLLTAAHVKAFLCDTSTCQNPNPSTSYYYGNGADPTSGGGNFTTDANGLGPNDAIIWTRADHFGGVYGSYANSGEITGRAAGTSTAWPNTPGNSCNGWTNTSSSYTGTYGLPAVATAQRWSYTSASCTYADKFNAAPGVICMVNP